MPAMICTPIPINRIAVALIAVLYLCLSTTCPVWAQADNKDGANGQNDPARKVDKAVPDKYNSPRRTMETFLEAAISEKWEDARPCMDLTKVNSAEFEILATKLYNALGKIERVETLNMPGPNDLDGVTSYTLFPRADSERHYELIRKYGQLPSIVFEPSSDGLWQFSADTVARISELSDKLADENLVAGEVRQTYDQIIEKNLPVWMKDKGFGLKYWQWAGILLLILAGVILDQLVRLLVRLIASRVLARLGRKPEPAQLQAAAKPIGLLGMALFWVFMVKWLGVSGIAFSVVYGAASIFAVLVSILAAWRFTDLIADAAKGRASKTETNIDDVLIPLVRKAVKIFIVIFGIIYGALSLDFNVIPLLGALGIGGVGFAFAAKDTLENFFGSATVLIDRPFTIGDWVVIGGGAEGTVEEIGFRSTRIRTFYNSLITVPNANLVRAEVDNYGARKYRRYKSTLGVQYDTTQEQMLAFTEGIRELIRQHPFTRKDYYHVYFTGYGASSLEILLYVFFEVPDWAVELREKERLNMDILRLADKLGVQFAFPTQTLHIQNMDPDAQHAPAPTPEADSDQKSQHMGMRVAQQLTKNQSWQKTKPGRIDYGAGPPGDDDEQDSPKKSQIEQKDAGG